MNRCGELGAFSHSSLIIYGFQNTMGRCEECVLHAESNQSICTTLSKRGLGVYGNSHQNAVTKILSLDFIFHHKTGWGL